MTVEDPDLAEIQSERSKLLAESLEFLKERLDGKIKPYETIHPWRKHGRFVVLHTLRVEATALRLLASEQPDASEEDAFILHLAARLHDVARLDAGRDHAVVGAGIVRSWLEAQPVRMQVLPDLARLLDIIAAHSQKDGEDEDILSAILKDADLLDEIGALSIFLAGNHVERSSPDYYRLLVERLESAELAYCDESMAHMHTRAGRQMLQERRRFIESFIVQLRLEQEGALDAGF